MKLTESPHVGVEMRGLADRLGTVRGGREREELRIRISTFWWYHLLPRGRLEEKQLWGSGNHKLCLGLFYVKYLAGSHMASPSSNLIVGLPAPTYRGSSTFVRTLRCTHSFEALRKRATVPLSPEKKNLMFPGCAKKMKVHMSWVFATFLDNY